MAEEIAQWLDRLGLGQYAPAFADNAVELSHLPHLTDDDLKELGLPLGPRRHLQAAIETLSADQPTIRPAGPAGQQPEARPIDAERRQLTVLFCDLVGSTALSSKLDPEDMREVLRVYQDACAGVIARYDGYVAKFMGDGVYAYFGYPRAHEDDAERAINAGLGIVEAVGNLEHDLQVRIGLATGTVAVGDIIGEGASEEAAIVGEAPNLAARLQEIAEPNTVVIAPNTHKLAGRLFESRSLGEQSFKGFDTPIIAWTVLRPRQIATRFEALTSDRLTALMGRDEERDALGRRWRRAQDGDGQAVLISGEPGIGKSRLVHTLMDDIEREPHFLVQIQCSPFHSSSALYPFIEQMARYIGFEPEDGDAIKCDKLESWIALASQDAADVGPLFAALLGIECGDRWPMPEMSPRRQKMLTLDALVHRPSQICEDQPFVLVVEDAHWIDPTTLELLDMMVENAAGRRIFIVITCRPEFASPWSGRSHVTLQPLNRLGRRDCGAIADSLTGGKELPDAVRDQIVDRTDGVPLFVEELTKSVLESGVLEEGTDRFELKGPMGDLAVPVTLRDSLEARLDRLESVKDIAQIGSVIGRVFRYDLLAFVTPLSETELDDALGRLVRSELVSCRGQPPDATYTFKHALVQDTAYGSLLRDRRAELHGSIAAVLERNFPDTMETAPEILAHHFTEARLPEAGTKYWLKAGESALRRSAMLEGIAHLEVGLKVSDTLPPGHQRDELLVRFHLARASALRQARGPMHPDVGESYSKAYELSQGLEDSELRFSASVGWLAASYARAESSNVLEHAQELLDLAAGNSAQLGMAHMVMGEIHWMQGRSETAVPHLTRATELYDPSSHASTAMAYGRDFGVFSGGLHSVALAGLGYPDKALDVARGLVELGESLRRSSFLLYAFTYEMLVLMLRRDTEELNETAENMSELGKRERFPAMVSMARLHTIWVKSQIDKHYNGGPEMERVISELQLPLWLRPWYDAMLAGVYLHGGQCLPASKVAEETLAWSSECGIAHYDGPLFVIQGDARFGLDPAAGTSVESCYAKAIEIARSQSAKLFELRAATALARLWHSQDKTTDARDLLGPIHDWFTEGFDTADLKEAKALLGELG